MKKFTGIFIVGFMATSLLALTILVMVGQAWARESQEVTVATSQETLAEFRQEAVSLNQPGVIKFLSGPNAGEPLDIALAFIQANREALGLSASDLADVMVTDLYQTKDTGVTHIYLRQRHQGLEVASANLNINIAADGSVINLGSHFVSNLAENIRGDAPALTAAAATEAAARHLKLTITQPLLVEESLGGANQAVILSDGGISINPIPARLVYQPYRNSVRLAWNITIYQLDSQHWWNMQIDAATGEMLAQDDWVDAEQWRAPAATSLLTGTYRVYTYPAESPNHVTPLPPADGRQSAIDPADPTASPFGWHDTDGVSGPEFTTTQGNNVHAYTDVDANDLPDPGSSPDGTAALNFDFPLDLTQAPSAYRPAAVTNLFYWNNLIHDVSYLHGFDEAAGNFQENNYGNGGAGNDYVLAEAQDGSGTDNANFGTPPDGQNPRMQMYIWIDPDPDKDGDLDNGIVLHEYGHGISNRLTGGPDNVDCLFNNEQMGEGWSDWQSLIHTMEVGDQGTDLRGVGTYALDQPTNGPGIRPAPYSTDLGINAYTYGDIGSLAIPHGVGFVWAAMLWEMNWALIDVHGFNPNIYGDWTTGGNNLAYRLVQDGMKLQTCSPGFVDGRDAILLADQILTSGANQCVIWEAFAKRGLGFSADQGSSNSTTDGTEAFDLPLECLTTLFITKSASPDPANPGGTLTYTLVASNYTTATLTNVVISDVVPVATTYVPGSASDGGSESGGVVTWPAITMASGDIVTRTFQVDVDPSVTTFEIFSDNFEAGTGNWTMTGLWNEESQSDTCGALVAPYPDPINAVYYGQDTICNYDVGITVGELTLVNSIFLPPGSQPILSFQSYEATECGGGACGFDNRNVQLSTDGGSSWTTLSQGGTEGAWHTASFDLSAFTGSDVLLRFQFDSSDDLFNDFFGWMVDDIRVRDNFYLTNTACVSAAEGDNDCDTIETLVQGEVVTGTLSGTVTAAESGAPIDGAIIQADNGLQTFAALTNGSGNYSMDIPVAVYDVTASATNRLPVTVSGVAIMTATTTIQDFSLEGGIFEYAPPAIEEFMEIGNVVTNTVTITNSGALTVEWAANIGNFVNPALQLLPGTITPLANTTAPVTRQTTAYQAEGIAAYGDIDAASLTKNTVDVTYEAPAITSNSGGLTVFTDRSVFDATYPDLPLENFENTLVPPNSVFTCDGPFDNATNNACFSPGGILDGISLNNTTPGEQMVVLTAGFVGVPSAVVGPNSFADELDIYFTEDVRAVGLDLFLPLNPGGNIDISVYTTGDVLIGTATSTGDDSGVFWGVSTSEPITRIHLAGTGGDGELVDNIAFGNTAPPWATAVPGQGTLPPFSVSTFDVVFDARSLYQLGDYLADLTFSGTFVNDVPTMPLTMHLSCSTCGFLNGSITDALTNDPLTATIHVTSTNGFDVNISGASYTMAVLPGLYNFTVSANGYLPETAAVTAVQAMTITTDFALYPAIALLDYAPSAIEEFMLIGDVVTNTVTVTNNGYVDLEFEAHIGNVGGPELLVHRSSSPVQPYLPPTAGTAEVATLQQQLLTVEDYGKGSRTTVSVPEQDLLLDQQPNAFDGIFADVSCDICGGAQVLAENFSLPNAETIGQIVFWTGYFPGDVPVDPDNITVIFHEDGAGLPGAVIASETNVPYERVQTGAILFGVHEWMHTLTLASPISLDAGNYWVEIYNDTGFGSDDFFWETGNADSVGNGLPGSAVAFTAPGSGWLYDPFTEFAIQLLKSGPQWVSAVPESGTVPPGASTTFDVVFDARSLYQVGDYTADLTFSGNFVNMVPAMPLTMHVSCPTCGFLDGSITDAFTGNPVVANIHVTSTTGFDVALSGDTYALAVQPGDYNITVSVAGYFSQTASVTAVQAMTVTTDFALVPIIAWLDYEPTVVEETVALGSIFTSTMTIANTGTIPFDYTLADVELGSPLMPLARTVAITCPPDAFGYTCTDSTESDGLVVYNFEDISSTGTAVFLGDDEVSSPIPVGFTFNFYGTDYTNLYISSNGFLTVLPGQSNGCCSGQPIPTPGDPDGLIAGVWSDLFPPGAGTIHYQTMGNAPFRYTIVQFTDIPHCCDPSFFVTFQFKLFEGSNNIEVHYRDAPSNGGTQAAGIENENGTIGLQYYLDTGNVGQDLAVCYLYPGQSACGSGGSDAPWLYEEPVSGTLAAGSQINTDIIFDATAVTQTGTYTAALYFSGTYDNNVTPAPIIMHVVNPVYALDLSPDAALTGDPGTTVTYTVTVFNNSNVADVIHLAVNGATWTTTLSDNTVLVSAGSSTDVLVTVDIPTGTAPGGRDVATITATSQGSGGSVTASADLTTSATGTSMYLPVIRKP